MDKEKNTIYFYRQKNIEIVQGRSIHSFPKHSHAAFCIGIVTEGKMQLSVKGKEYVLEKNHVYFIPPSTEHRISSIGHEEYGYTVICLLNDCIEQYSNVSLRNYICNDEKVGMRFLNICEEFYNHEECHKLENEIKEILSKSIELVLDRKKQSFNEGVEAAVKFIKEHLEEPFDLKRISEHAFISKYHLIRIFKKEMGIAPYQFYVQEKVKNIKQGLLKEQSIADLAYDFNFSDQSHLCNVFKKYVGLTPIQFKKNYKASEGK